MVKETSSLFVVSPAAAIRYGIPKPAALVSSDRRINPRWQAPDSFLPFVQRLGREQHRWHGSQERRLQGRDRLGRVGE
jgi:hypothetical protein